MTEEWTSLSKKSTNGRKLFRKVAPLRWAFRALSPIAPEAAGRAAFRLFRTTRRHRMPARERGWIASAERIWLGGEDGWLSGWSWGTGPTVLLMHGWNGRASQMGALAEGVAEAGYRAIAIDAPGHGDSVGGLSSLPQFADAVERAAERFGPLHAVVAHSFGAAGAGWAMRRGLDVGRAVFVAAPGDLHGYVEGFRELFGLSRKGFDSMLTTLEKRFGVRWNESRYATTIAADPTPVLIVHDRDDGETHYRGALEIETAWPESRIVTTEGLGHRRILRDPTVVERVTEFLGEERGPTPRSYPIDLPLGHRSVDSAGAQLAT